MDDQYVAMLNYAVGAPPPLRLVVDSPSAPLPTVVEVAAPFAILGRGANSDVFLSGESVAFRHVYLQVVGRRVACIDLFSKTGIDWGDHDYHGWLSPDFQFQVGDHTLQLCNDGWKFDDEVKSPVEFRPKSDVHPDFGALPEVKLELINTAHKGRMWPINRLITLVGRDDRCRITCADDSISKVHCSLLLLPSGLWAIDLLGKDGIQVNGVPCRCAPLGEGSEVQIGKYLLRAHYPQLEGTPHVAVAQPAALSQGEPSPQPVGMLAQTYPPEPAPTQIVIPTGSEFLTKHHRILKVETYNDTLIVLPLGDIQDFSYQEFHVEVSRINELMDVHNYRNLVVDFSQVALVGSLILEALTGFCRSARGRAVFCEATPEMYDSLLSLNLVSIWMYYPTRYEALHAVYAPS